MVPFPYEQYVNNYILLDKIFQLDLMLDFDMRRLLLGDARTPFMT